VHDRASRVEVWGDCPDTVKEGIEDVTSLKIEQTWFANHAGSVVMLQLEEGTVIGADLLRVICSMEICYKGFLYCIHEVKSVPVSSGESFNGGARFLLIFSQSTMMM
jgi:hypothetical protein